MIAAFRVEADCRGDEPLKALDFSGIPGFCVDGDGAVRRLRRNPLIVNDYSHRQTRNLTQSCHRMRRRPADFVVRHL